MSELAAGKCVPCRGGEPALTEAETVDLLSQLPHWQLVTRDGIPHLERVFKLKNYAQALELTNKIAAIAEEQDHHPLIVLEWGKVTVQWWTHVVKGLHRNDFIMAAKTDNLADVESKIV
jgi:4a-hydroxytetrahydrobiopterin dehydratase